MSPLSTHLAAYAHVSWHIAVVTLPADGSKTRDADDRGADFWIATIVAHPETAPADVIARPARVLKRRTLAAALGTARRSTQHVARGVGVELSVADAPQRNSTPSVAKYCRTGSAAKHALAGDGCALRA
jgi:hypothetical protein